MTTFVQDNKFVIRHEGKIKTHNDFVKFKSNLKEALGKYKDSIKSNDLNLMPEPTESSDSKESKDAKDSKINGLKIMLIDAFPCNTYALGYLLKLKRRDGYDFQITTNDFDLFDLLESIEFDKVFDLMIEKNRG